MKKVKASTTVMGTTAILIAVAIVASGVGFLTGRNWNFASTAASSCTSLALSQGSSSGAAGTIYKNAVITNTGDAACTITGYPGTFMQNADGIQLGSGAAANSLYSPTKVALAPGAKAHTVVAFPQQPNFPPNTCSAIGSSMKMYVPGLETALVTPWSDYNCPGFSATAIQPGAE